QANHGVLVESIEKGNIDWGISIQKPKRQSLDYAQIGSFEVVFCCAQELYERFIDPVDLLNNIPFGETNWDRTLNNAIYKYLRRNAVIPREKILSDHGGFLQKLCARGRCVTYLAKNPLKEYEGLKTFTLDEPLKVTLYAIWKKSDEGLISILKLKELIQSNLTSLPHRYEDVDLQIEISEVSDDLLK
ncbi:MAG: LysR substrate-binding domain-containing protein, partial [Bacteriovoracaceae bacterium]|nr:LysR substrate-binding domain-containing protein [Bacteriovoracaceae bacterium]